MNIISVTSSASPSVFRDLDIPFDAPFDSPPLIGCSKERNDTRPSTVHNPVVSVMSLIGITGAGSVGAAISDAVADGPGCTAPEPDDVRCRLRGVLVFGITAGVLSDTAAFAVSSPSRSSPSSICV